MSAQDIWARKYHELWEKLEKNTKHSFCTALWKWLVILNLLGNYATNAEHEALILRATNYARLACFVKLQAWCDKKGLDTVIHPIPKCLMFLEDLLSDVVAKKSKDPFRTIRVARKTLSKIRYVS